ncbi:MAG TPA: hypothetical protein VGD40_17410 [Chryseosolibacter sp.]
MIIALSTVFVIAFSWTLFHIGRSETDLRKLFFAALAMKILAGISLGMLYTYHYRTGDTLLFFDNALRLVSLAQIDFASYTHYIFSSEFLAQSVEIEFFDSRAILMVKIVSIFGLFSFANYWVISVYMSALSFLGAWFLVRQIMNAFPKATAPAIVAFLFFPSVVFWTSGVIKETLAMAGLYFLCGVLVRIWVSAKLNIVHIFLAMLSCYILWSLKYYFAGIFFAIAAATVFYRFTLYPRFVDRKRAWGHLQWMGVFLILILVVTLLHPNFYLNRMLEVLVANYEAFIAFSEPGAAMRFHNLEPTLRSLVLNAPAALLGGLFRPLFFDARNLLAVFLSIENAALLTLLIISLRYASKLFTTNVSILLCAIVVYVILLAIFITLSTPNFGTLARYRVGYLPFFVFLISLSPPIVARLQKIIQIPAKGN